MRNEFSRSQILLGTRSMERLRNSRVAVFGLGGVGSFAAEALVRTGVGHLLLIDNDTVSLTNLNRQILADHSTIGKQKVDVMKERAQRIHPAVDVQAFPLFYLPDTPSDFLNDCDYIIDAIDTVSAKLALVQVAQEKGIPIISSMGTGNKLDPTRFEVADIYQTSVCPLCRVMRRELKKRGISSLKVVYSKEEPVPREENPELQDAFPRRQTPGSVAFVPPVAGFILAGEVIKDLTDGLRPNPILAAHS